jgi:hypothetical protein
MAELVKYHGQEVLQIQLAPDHFHMIPVDAIASWGELLGLETVEEVLTAMDQVRINGEPETNWETGENSWTEAYVALLEELDAEDAAVDPETYKHGDPFISGEEAVLLQRAGVRRADNGQDKINPRDRVKIAKERRASVQAATREKLLGKGLNVPPNARAAGKGPVIRPPKEREAFVKDAAAALTGFDLAESRRKFKNGLRVTPR